MTIQAQTTPRVLSLSEAAERLGMKRPNVAKFLARRGVVPAFAKAQGYLWWEGDIERVKADREADAERMASDRRRSRSARALRDGEVAREPIPPELARLGRTQRRLLAELVQRPVTPELERDRLALRRLADRGLAEPVDDGAYRLVDSVRAAAAWL